MSELLVEESILGTILKEPFLLQDADLKSEYFKFVEHQNILSAMKTLASKGQPIDIITLLTQSDPVSFGGASKLENIKKMANEPKFESYLDILQERWREDRKLNILEIAKHENWNLTKITTELNNLASNKVNDYNHIKDLMLKVAEAPWQEQKTQLGVNTGLKALQNATSGWQNGELIIIAARPSMGKTDVLLHLAKNAGWSNCIPIIFSLEMNAESLSKRLIASVGPYNRGKLKNPYKDLSDAQKDVWFPTIGRVSETNIEIFDNSGQTIPEMRMKIRKIKSLNPAKQIIVFIDYLTLIKPVNDFNGNMHLATSEISKSLKSLAKEFDCPVISLAQLSRSVEKRMDKRPMLSDLRESGSIEEDADVVMFLYRDAYYSKNEQDNTLELIIAKQRNGGVGTICAQYNKFTGAISDL